MKKKAILLSLLAMLAATTGIAAGNLPQKPARKTTKSNKKATMAEKKKTLVVFFSHAGENYSVGNIKVGNTRIVADYISELTGADQFEIVAEKDYDMSYMQLIEVAKREAKDGELPDYKDSIDVAPYDTVFVGGPIWWGTYPQVMFTFFRDNDLNGKTVIPFTTHEGSGLGSTVEDIKQAYPNANVTKGFAIAGHDVRSGKARVEKWLKGLGF